MIHVPFPPCFYSSPSLVQKQPRNNSAYPCWRISSYHMQSCRRKSSSSAGPRPCKRSSPKPSLPLVDERSSQDTGFTRPSVPLTWDSRRLGSVAIVALAARARSKAHPTSSRTALTALRCGSPVRAGIRTLSSAHGAVPGIRSLQGRHAYCILLSCVLRTVAFPAPSCAAKAFDATFAHQIGLYSVSYVQCCGSKGSVLRHHALDKPQQFWHRAEYQLLFAPLRLSYLFLRLFPQDGEPGVDLVRVCMKAGVDRCSVPSTTAGDR